MKGGWVYIITNKPYGTLYVAVTNDIRRRAWEHREGVAPGFTKRYGLNLLVYAEHHDEIGKALQREKNIKHWQRRWTIELIETLNADWKDLYPTLA